MRWQKGDASAVGGRKIRLVSGIALLALFVAVVGVALGAGGASAGDNVAVLEFEPEELSVEPGDTVEVDVTLRSHGEFTDVGVASVELRLDYPTEYLTVTAVEPGSWFDEAPDNDPLGEGQADTAVSERVAYADESGAALFEQSLDSPEFGVIGTATVATVTLAVSEDAEAATAQLAAERTRVYPTRSRYSQPTSVAPAEFHVDGGGDVVEPAFVEDPFADIDEEGSVDDGADAGDEGDRTGAGDDDGTTNDSAASEAGEDETDDDVPAPLGAIVLGVLVTAFGVRRRGRE